MSNPFYELASPALRCTLCDRGASIMRVQVRGSAGEYTDVALSPGSLLSGEADPSLAGRTIGPCCGRVRNGEASIGGKPFQLTQNEGRSHLHGGRDGCAHRRWEVLKSTPSTVQFCTQLPDGLDGYPGNRVLFAEYTLDGSALRVVYSAMTDALTWIDMTNHVYWDLSGRFDGGAMDQQLQIAGSRVVFNDDSHLPRGIVDADSAFDFTVPCAPADKLMRYGDHPQLRIGRGFNNAFVIDAQMWRSLGFAARLYAPQSGIAMAMDTDQPAVVLYTGGFLDASTRLQTEPGAASSACGIALEAQGLPDPFHLPGAHATLLSPGETYRHEIVWSFET